MKNTNFSFSLRMKHREHRWPGQGMVEFALVLPVLLTFLLSIVELARLFHAWIAIENGARFGIRYAVTGEYDPAHCAGGNDGTECLYEDDIPYARVASIQDAVELGSRSVIADYGLDATDIENWTAPMVFKTTICVSPQQDGDPERFNGPTFGETDTFSTCDGGDDAGDPGDMISVTVDFNHPIIAPFVSSIWPQLHLNARREAIVEDFRTSRAIVMPLSIPTLPPTMTYTPSPTPLPTNTPTPSLTPTEVPTIANPPDCSELRIYDNYLNGGDYVIEFGNRSTDGWSAYLTQVILQWENSSADLDSMDWDGWIFWNDAGVLDDKAVRTINNWSPDPEVPPGEYKYWVGKFTAPLDVPGTWYDVWFTFEYRYGAGQTLVCSPYDHEDGGPTETPSGPTNTPTMTYTPDAAATDTPTDEPEPATSTPTFTHTPDVTDTPTATSTPITPTPTTDLGD